MGGHLHPLDWAAYLRQSLVLSSTPTALTLLVLAAHYHACCPPPEARGALASSNGTSVLGSLFAASWAAANHTAACPIRTPWNRAAPQPVAQPGPEEPDDAEPPARAEEDQPAAASHSILGASMKDPFTLAYSAWEFFTAPSEQVRIQQPRRKTSASCEWMLRRRRHRQQHELRGQDRARGEAIWMDVCVMHAVGMLGVLFALLPSVVAGGPRLACNAAIPAANASAWPLLNCSALMFGLSWVVCSALQHAAGLPELALCACMHLVARLVAAFADVALSCPLPPIYMPGAAATGMGFALGLLLLCISQMHAASGGAAWSEGFYMNHLWASCAAVFVVRCVSCS